MKIAEYQQMMDYLTGPREKFSNGGAVRENISPMKSGSGNIIGYRVRSRKQGIEKFFSTSQYGSLEEALNAAKQFRKEKLGTTLTNEDYLKLRNANKNLSSKEFANFLNKSPEGYKPKKGDKFTKIGVKQRDLKVDFKTTRKVEKKIVDQNIKDEIYEKYLKAVKEGKREGSIVGLGRKYFPGETKDSQQKAIQRILREKGEDITKFKKTGPGTGTTAIKKTRTEKLIKGKKFAGSEAGQLSDEIFLDIKAMNDKVKNMSLEDIAANKKYIQSMRLNASMENLSKGVLAFDKYKDLTDLEVAQKIKERAAANKFFDIEHISGVKGGTRNIYFPNNLQMATGNIGSFMDNFKRIPVEQPNNQVINQIDNFLSSYNLTVRDAKNNIRLGNKKVIQVTDGVSNIVADNFKAVNTSFEKQTVVKPTPSKSVTKQSIVKTGEITKRLAAIGCPGKAKGGRIGFQEGTVPSTQCVRAGAEIVNKGKFNKLSPGQRANLTQFLNRAAKIGRTVMKFGVIPEAIFVAGESLVRMGMGDTLDESLLRASDYLLPGNQTKMADQKKFERTVGPENALTIMRARDYKNAIQELADVEVNADIDIQQNMEDFTGISDQKLREIKEQRIKQATQNVKNKFISEADRDKAAALESDAIDIAGTNNIFKKIGVAARNAKVDEIEQIAAPGQQKKEIAPPMLTNKDLADVFITDEFLQKERDELGGAPELTKENVLNFYRGMKPEELQGQDNILNQAYFQTVFDDARRSDANKERFFGTQRDFFGGTVEGRETPTNRFANFKLGMYAGGGIAKLAGKSSGPAPEKGPTSQGLAFFKNNGRKL